MKYAIAFFSSWATNVRADDALAEPFDRFFDSKGHIQMTADFHRDWTVLDAWSIAEDRFPDHPLLGEARGWTLFSAGQPEQFVARDLRTDCTACHMPARQDRWIYVEDYPVLQRPGS